VQGEVGSPGEEFEDFDDELSDAELTDLELDVRSLLARHLPVTEESLQAARDALQAVQFAYPMLPLAHDVSEARGPHATEVRSLLFRGHGLVVDVTITETGDRCELVGRIRPRCQCRAAVVTTDAHIELPERTDSTFHGRRLPRRPTTLVLTISDGGAVRRYRTEWTRL
jgi:hypothetical protein